MNTGKSAGATQAGFTHEKVAEPNRSLAKSASGFRLRARTPANRLKIPHR